MTTSQNSITSNAGGTTFAGREGVDVYRLTYLKRMIDMHKRTGMIPTRGWSGRKMLDAATQSTGKKYKRNDHDKAIRDIDALLDVKVTRIHEEMAAADAKA